LGETRSDGPVCVVVMGPSGIGKTTLAQRLADKLGWAFAEGDSFHPPANIAKMRQGIPLDDADRAPWLEVIRDWIARHAAAGRPAVITCSALKRRYRDVLRGAGGRVRFVQLVGEPSLVERRIHARTGHHMPPSLLSSQLATLEPLEADEDGVLVSIAGRPDEVASMTLTALGLDLAAGADG
jgi:gluconokinase